MSVKVGPLYECLQRWDDVNCRAGVALPMGFPSLNSPRGQSCNGFERAYVWLT